MINPKLTEEQRLIKILWIHTNLGWFLVGIAIGLLVMGLIYGVR